MTQTFSGTRQYLDTIAVASHSFPKNAILRRELLERYPHAAFNETGRPLAGERLIAFLRGHTKAITGLEVLNEEVFESVPEVRLVSKYGVGLDTIDVDAARRHGVEIRWTPGVNRTAVAELTLCFMIALCRRLIPVAADVKAGVWRHEGGRQLSSATVGVVGCGHVGQQVARLCRAFGATVLATDIRDYATFYAETGVSPVTLDVLLVESDIVSLHVPLDASTRGLIGAKELAKMRPGAVLVNTARGGVVNEPALADALSEGRLAGAACDVFEVEPPGDQRLLSRREFVATPHMGGGTLEAVLAMGRAAIAGLDRAPTSIDVTKGIPQGPP
jgi:phosphoglycerate dehydrogenase-like enzyme